MRDILCVDGIVLYPNCGDGYTIYSCDKLSLKTILWKNECKSSQIHIQTVYELKELFQGQLPGFDSVL
jgi:hypothetical protein